jgi:hypothetical protein
MAREHEIVAGCRMPSDRGIRQLDRAREIEAERGSARLLARMNDYLRRHQGEAGHG